MIARDAEAKRRLQTANKNALAGTVGKRLLNTLTFGRKKRVAYVETKRVTNRILTNPV